MARYIYCEKCNNKVAESAKLYGELYESMEGVAIKDIFCDGPCGGFEATPIKEGDKCFAAVILNNASHPNYEHHKPESWMREFIKPL